MSATTKHSISEADFNVIRDLVGVSGDLAPFELIEQLETIFEKDTQAIHYTVLGFLVGCMSATHFKMSDELNNDLCQRQN